MKILIAEDDYICRALLQTLLEKYGECHLASDGEEALFAFLEAHDDSEPFELICLDIMMPKKDGQAVLRDIRKVEQERRIGGSDAVKVIMTTVLSDAKNIMSAFLKGACEGYLTKPIDQDKLEKVMLELGLIPISG